MYGKHACDAALRNPDRVCSRFCVTENAAPFFEKALATRPSLSPELAAGERIERYVGADARHQGAALLVEPLKCVPPAFLGERHTVVIADGVTDPQNMGAMLRAAAAFGVEALYAHDRSCPPEGAALAKAASGHLDTVPFVREKNLANVIRKLKEDGFFVAFFAADAPNALYETEFAPRQAFIFGSEGEGVRRLLRELSDVALSAPMHPVAESLNVAMTAGIALSWRYAQEAKIRTA